MNLTQDIKSKKGIYILTLDSEKKKNYCNWFSDRYEGRRNITWRWKRKTKANHTFKP